MFFAFLFFFFIRLSINPSINHQSNNRFRFSSILILYWLGKISYFCSFFLFILKIFPHNTSFFYIFSLYRFLCNIYFSCNMLSITLSSRPPLISLFSSFILLLLFIHNHFFFLFNCCEMWSFFMIIVWFYWKDDSYSCWTYTQSHI
jgi:hypothetical protein